MPRILAALLCLLPLPSTAAAHWLCGLSEDLTRIVCVADAEKPVVAEAPPVTAVVNGTVFPLDPRRIYTVELWGLATDAAFAEQLARATLCYRSPDCEVTFSAPGLAPQPVALRARWRR